MEVVVQFALIHQLRVLSIALLEFDGNFEVGLGVDALIDLSKGSLIKFFDNFVVLTNLFRNLRHLISIKLNYKFFLR